MILAIDFDGVIHDRKNPIPGKTMGAPMPQAIEALQDLYLHGHEIIVHTLMATTESGRQAVIDWLDYYDVDHSGVTAIKPKADWYIDDKAIQHVDWPSTMAQLGLNTL